MSILTRVLFMTYICLQGQQFSVEIGYDKNTNTFHVLKAFKLFIPCDGSGAEKIDLNKCVKE